MHRASSLGHETDSTTRDGPGAVTGRPAPRLAVFSDLDGTLLDEHYRHDAADPILERLRTAGIPLILTSSKTLAEMTRLRAELAPGMPVIFENGCGIATPTADGGEAVERFGPDYASLRRTLAALTRDCAVDFRGFGDMSDEEVAERTGLDTESARLARAREASEPGVIGGGEAAVQRLRAALEDVGLRLVRGGRFHHVMPRADKADAMRTVAGRLRAAHPDLPLVTIAAGDSENDADMLAAADHAVVVRRADGSWLDLAPRDHVLRSEAIGPAGWAECLGGLLDRFEADQRAARTAGETAG